jgi:S-adenosylmethionine synthetase
MNLLVTRRGPYDPQVEFVERKGAGHPDTICDHLAEELARELARKYIEHTGTVQHFNVDKAVLAAGSVELGFGDGHHTKASRLVLVGKADSLGDWRPDPDRLAVEWKQKLLDVLPDAGEDAFEVEVWLNQSSPDLRSVVTENVDTAPLANDTSFAAFSTPRSNLEAAVYRVEKLLNSDDYRAGVPIGRDIKVMGARVGEDARLTVAVPVLARKVSNRAEYDEVLASVREQAVEESKELLGSAVDVRVNQADLAESPYLTLTGTSAEAGDDGQVGRGNRFGGLITPYRPMSLEAAAGKNPAAHVGKTYHAVAADIASKLLEMGVEETTIRLLSSIGHPVTDPQAAHVEVTGDIDAAAIGAVVEECFADWSGVRDRIIAGQYELY